MICKSCGAVIDKDLEKCPLCGNKIDKGEIFREFIEKGNAAFEMGDIDKAVLFYKNALEHGDVNEETYIKIGIAFEKKNDFKSARDMYFKALTLNFENDNAHNLLIGIYSKLNKLNDLKNWYESNAERLNYDTANKYAKIIENIINFKKQPLIKIAAGEDDLKTNLIKGLKNYMILNVVIGIVMLLLAAAILGYYVFKINGAYILAFAAIFFVISLSVIMYYKMRNIRRMQEKKPKIEDLFGEDSKK